MLLKKIAKLKRSRLFSLRNVFLVFCLFEDVMKFNCNGLKEVFHVRFSEMYKLSLLSLNTLICFVNKFFVCWHSKISNSSVGVTVKVDSRDHHTPMTEYIITKNTLH